MSGFRYRHLMAQGGPEGTRSAFQPASAPVSLYPNDSGTGVVVYVAPPYSAYDSLGGNPDASPTNIQMLKGIYVVSDKTVTATSVSSDITFSLYRAGAAIGGSSIAAWASGANPLLTVGVPVKVPFNISNTSLLAVPTYGPAGVVTTAAALLPMQPGDCILATATTVADLVNLFAFVDAQ
jgi:hypothetical protein